MQDALCGQNGAEGGGEILHVVVEDVAKIIGPSECVDLMGIIIISIRYVTTSILLTSSTGKSGKECRS